MSQPGHRSGSAPGVGASRSAALLTFAVLLLCLAVGVATAFAGKSTSSVMAGAGIEGGLLRGPTDIAVNQTTGQIYVADSGNQRIQRLAADGSFERAWGRGVVAPGGTGDVGDVNEQQEVTINATGGNFTLRFRPWFTEPFEDTAAIPFGASAATVESSLEALSHFDPGDVAVGGADGGPYTVEFAGRYAATDVSQLSGNSSGLTGGVPFAEVNVKTIAGAPAFEICTIASECRPGGTGMKGDDPGGEVSKASGTVQLAIDQASGDLYVSDDLNRISAFDGDRKSVV